MPESAYELVGKLPTRVRFVRRFQARHRPLNRLVEFRFERQRGDPTSAARFAQEMDELARLDHPCFLPVLDRGAMRGRPGYVVPFREHPTIPEMVRAGDFGLSRALAAVRSLAAGLAAAHEAGFFLGPIRPRYVAWDEAAGGAYLLHHRVGAPSYLVRRAAGLPEDVRPEAPESRAGDLYHWGYFAYYLLSRGQHPHGDDGGAPVPLRDHCPELSPAITAAIEAALADDPGERPRDGAAIREVTQAAGLELAAEPEAAGPEPEMLASARFQAVVQDLEGRRQEPDESWMEGGESAEAEGPSGDTSEHEAVPDLGLFRSGGVPAMGAEALAKVARRAGELPPSLQAAAPWVVGGLLLALVGSLAWLVGSSPAPTPPGPAASSMFRRSENDGSIAPDGGIQALGPAQAAPFRRNPLIRQLLQLEEVTPQLYPKVMQRLIDLADDGRLPSAFQDPERLDDIGKLHRNYPPQACRELTKVLDDLRVVLGPAS